MLSLVRSAAAPPPVQVVTRQTIPQLPPRLWPESTIACIATGPSLTPEDCLACHAAGIRILAINDAYRYAPFADALYAPDGQWWKWHTSIPDHNLPPRLFSIQIEAVELRPSITYLRYTRLEGFLDEHGLRTGGHSGYQAIQLAAYLGAVTIILLGYDMQAKSLGNSQRVQHHFFGEHPDRSSLNYRLWIGKYADLAHAFARKGICVINASRHTAIPYFARMSLTDALALGG